VVASTAVQQKLGDSLWVKHVEKFVLARSVPTAKKAVARKRSLLEGNVRTPLGQLPRSFHVKITRIVSRYTNDHASGTLDAARGEADKRAEPLRTLSLGFGAPGNPPELSTARVAKTAEPDAPANVIVGACGILVLKVPGHAPAAVREGQQVLEQKLSSGLVLGVGSLNSREKLSLGSLETLLRLLTKHHKLVGSHDKDLGVRHCGRHQLLEQRHVPADPKPAPEKVDCAAAVVLVNWLHLLGAR
jgi:hypothetical protein